MLVATVTSSIVQPVFGYYAAEGVTGIDFRLLSQLGLAFVQAEAGGTIIKLPLTTFPGWYEAVNLSVNHFLADGKFALARQGAVTLSKAAPAGDGHVRTTTGVAQPHSGWIRNSASGCAARCRLMCSGSSPPSPKNIRSLPSGDSTWMFWKAASTA